MAQSASASEKNAAVLKPAQPRRLTARSKTPSLVAAEVTRLTLAERNVGQSEPPTPKMGLEDWGNTHSSREFSCSVAPHRRIGTYVGCYFFNCLLTAGRI